jgi:hypothetical protein
LPTPCPYCGSAILKSPARKTKCLACGRYIHVRSGRLVTEEGAQIVDWLKKIAVTEVIFEQTQKALAAQFGKAPSHRDVLWRILNELVLRPPSGVPRKMVYWWMAEFTYEEGRDFQQYLRLSHEVDLAQWNASFTSSPDIRVKVLTAGSASCEPCRRLEHTLFPLEQALANGPLPTSDCSHPLRPGGRPGWCRCCYGLVFDGSP